MTAFKGFIKADFDTFTINGLEERMKAIQTRIQPKFQTIGEDILQSLSVRSGLEMFLHIAKHARRKVNPPVDTWMAIANNKRGYKQHPHFQIGLFDDRVFIWLAFIYELPNKKEIAEKFLQQAPEIKQLLPADVVISFDHMRKDALSLSAMDEEQWKQGLERFRDVKKAELLIGRNIMKDDPVLQDGEKFIELANETFDHLLPLYHLSMGMKN
ncbi:DUF1054 domain-containing protein [Paenibacillus validus]|uniref:DUF1054 domain-containing protein n=1 Tax=Paenibacillus TaxID=44249 RepID=UPI0006D1196A|nr:MULTISPECIES: DUF1054 domain-containing protein [Paenibacillus]MED4600129.1 DUF1054 domain-containing protein [Paenibacillus validus]MED4607699.1 DUF1054 domain-containing protein [Paenibacillus validus]